MDINKAIDSKLLQLLMSVGRRHSELLADIGRMELRCAVPGKLADDIPSGGSHQPVFTR
jgi:hypothetical protein